MGLFGPGKDFWEDPNSAWTHDWAAADKGVNDALSGIGFVPKQVDPNAPGSSVDTSNADEDRNKLTPLINQLSQTAATGGGAWEQAFRDATQKASNSAQALGQSQPGTDYQSSLRNIGNAQGAVGQTAVGQGNILRNQAKSGAQDQLTQLQGAMNADDATQSAAVSAANQGVNELNNTLKTNASKAFENATGGIASVFGYGSGKSDGGVIHGKPRVAGDDSRNDTVPAMLSPGEIVIPRSHARTPEAAADFVRALQQHEQRRAGPGVEHLADGGQAGGSGLSNTSADGGTTALQVLLPHVGQAVANSMNGAQAPSVGNGGLFDTTNTDDSRQAFMNSSNQLLGQAVGNGPSVVGQQNQNSVDANIAAGMAPRRVGAGQALMGAVLANQGAAGNAGQTKNQEQVKGENSFAQAMMGQRARDAALANAQQQAAFRNTQINAGIALDQQAALRGVLGGAGQAAMTGAKTIGKADAPTPTSEAADSASGSGGGTESDPESSFDGIDSEDLWTGGRVQKYADGGQVTNAIQLGQPSPEDEQEFARVIASGRQAVPAPDDSEVEPITSANRQNTKYGNVDIEFNDPTVMQRQALPKAYPGAPQMFLRAPVKEAPVITASEPVVTRYGPNHQRMDPPDALDLGDGTDFTWAAKMAKDEAHAPTFYKESFERRHAAQQPVAKPGIWGAVRNGAASIFGPRASLEDAPPSAAESRRAQDFVAALKKRKAT